MNKQTELSDFQCQDCGRVCVSLHNVSGTLTPNGISVKLCDRCYGVRLSRDRSGDDVLPIGQTDYTTDLAGKCIILDFTLTPSFVEPNSSPASFSNFLKDEGMNPYYYEGKGTIFVIDFSNIRLRGINTRREEINRSLNMLRNQYQLLSVTISCRHPIRGMQMG